MPLLSSPCFGVVVDGWTDGRDKTRLDSVPSVFRCTLNALGKLGTGLIQNTSVGLSYIEVGMV